MARTKGKYDFRQVIAALFLMANIAVFISLHALFGVEVTSPVLGLEVATLLVGAWPIAGYIGGFTISGSTVDIENSPENKSIRIGYFVTGVVVYVVGVVKLIDQIRW